MEIMNCSKVDFDQIISHFTEFWSSDRTLPLHHPTLINEFRNTAFVIKEADSSEVCAYLFGFYSQTEPVAYVHLLAVREKYQKLGLGRRLYEHFIECARKRDCVKVKAITWPTNKDSIGFHRRIGMEPVGKDVIDGINVVLDYAGPGEHRVVFMKDI